MVERLSWSRTLCAAVHARFVMERRDVMERCAGLATRFVNHNVMRGQEALVWNLRSEDDERCPAGGRLMHAVCMRPLM